jgi:hypothetical protein
MVISIVQSPFETCGLYTYFWWHERRLQEKPGLIAAPTQKWHISPPLWLHWSNLTIKLGWVQVAHACNASYSGGRDQEDHSSKPARGNSPWDPILKKSTTKEGLWSGSSCRPWVQAPVPQKKKIILRDLAEHGNDGYTLFLPQFKKNAYSKSLLRTDDCNF